MKLAASMLYDGAIGSDVPIFLANGDPERANLAAWARAFKHAIWGLSPRDVLSGGREYCSPVMRMAMCVGLRAAWELFDSSDRVFPAGTAPVFPCGDDRCELADHHADGRNCDLRLLHRTVHVFHGFWADNQNFCFDVFCDVVRLTKVALDLAPSGLRPVRALHSLLISWQSKQVASDIGVIFDRKQSHYIPGEMVAALEERTKGVGARTEALGTPARRGLGGQKRGR